MKKFKSNNGITLVALVIMIIVLLILAGVTINAGVESINVSKDNSYVSQLNMVQHEVLERYTEYKVTQNESVLVKGTASKDEVSSTIQSVFDEIGMNISNLKDSNMADYYELEPEDLEDLGIKDSIYTYIVNYKTGEVINITIKQTSEGEPLYIYAKTSAE
jgi:Tfp pilus assembly protein PilE